MFTRRNDIGHFHWLQRRTARIVAANPHLAEKILGRPPDPEPALPPNVLAGRGYIGDREARPPRRRNARKPGRAPQPPPPELAALMERVAAIAGETVVRVRGHRRTPAILVHARACIAVLAQEFCPALKLPAVDRGTGRGPGMTAWYRELHEERLVRFPAYADLFGRCRAALEEEQP